MDPVTMVCGTVVLSLLLGTPAVCVRMGWNWRGTATDEGEKRHKAEMALKERELTEWKTLAEIRKTAVAELEENYKKALNGIAHNSSKALERAALLNSSGNPTDIALRMLQGTEAGTAPSDSGASGSKSGDAQAGQA